MEPDGSSSKAPRFERSDAFWMGRVKILTLDEFWTVWRATVAFNTGVPFVISVGDEVFVALLVEFVFTVVKLL